MKMTGPSSTFKFSATARPPSGKFAAQSTQAHQTGQNREPFSWCSSCPFRPLAPLVRLPVLVRARLPLRGRGAAGADSTPLRLIELAAEVLLYLLADRHRRQVHMGLDPGGRIRLLQPVAPLTSEPL